MEANNQAKAILKYQRISPRKVKIVLDLIRGKDANMAMAILKNTPKSASEFLIKQLKSAISNAEVKGLDSSKLYVSECYVCPGPTLKRMMPRAKGSANRILKRTSHVTIVVAERAAKKVGGIATRNFGAVKGQTFERVLIVPTKNMEKYLSTGNVEEITAAKEKIYVAITRAKFSVAFLTSCQIAMDNVQLWK